MVQWVGFEPSNPWNYRLHTALSSLKPSALDKRKNRRKEKWKNRKLCAAHDAAV